MKKIKQIGIILFLISLSSVCRSQEHNLGGELGVISEFDFIPQAVTLSALFEFRPKNAFFSINTNPGLVVGREDLLFGSFPLFLKFIIGDKYRFCPKFGAFYWTNQRWGLTAGFNFEVQIKDKFLPFFGAEFIRGYFKEQLPSHSGVIDTSIGSFGALRYSIGLKYRMNYFNKIK
jgi:hypothetical protein